MSEALVSISGRPTPLKIRINGPNPTFSLASERISAQAVAALDPLLEDLLEVASTIFAADSKVTRGGETRPNMGSTWRRTFDFVIPVRHPEVWSDPLLMDRLNDAVSFLTDDNFTFRFIARPVDLPSEPFLGLDPTGTAFTADEVVLFSGGLDSLAGALEALSSTDGNVILVSHRSAQKVIPRQVNLGAELASRFGGRVQHIHVTARSVGRERSETTQRSRSLLFAALGQVVAKTFGAKTVSFYENGVISHNLPISPQVIGTMATRTTHPLALTRLNALMAAVLTQPADIQNHYQWLTKTEVVQRIARFGGADLIGKAVSCTSVRDQNILHTHCGKCSQCLDRRFAVLASGLDAHDPQEAYKTEVLYGTRREDQSRTMAVEWTRHALRLRELDQRSFFSAFGTELLRLVRGHPDMSGSEAMRLIQDMHTRHSDAVSRVLTAVIQERAGDIVARKLEPTSLLGLHLGADRPVHVAIPADPRLGAPGRKPIGHIEEADIVLDEHAPLVAAFSPRGEKPTVTVRGLGRFSGEPARVAHALKVPFDLDRQAGEQPEDHRFSRLTELVSDPPISKDAARQNVHRCREQLRAAFVAVFGKDPGKHLLIEGRQPKGHRLDPDLQLSTQERINQPDQN